MENNQKPKDKAFELYFKFEEEFKIYYKNGFYYDARKTKNGTLICVDEILNLLKNTVYNKQETFNFWLEVKKEIEKI